MSNHQANYINGARNIGILCGYARRQDGGLTIMQSDNAQQHLRVVLSRTAKPVRPDIPYQVRCHVRAERVGNTHQITLVASEAPRRASLGEVPRRLVTINSLRQQAGLPVGKDFNPFADIGAVRDAVRDAMLAKDIGESAVDEMLRDTKKGPKMERFTNHFVISGFIGHKAWYAAPEGSDDEHGYCMFLMHQFADPAKGIPIRVRGTDARFLKLLPIMQPVNVVASARMGADVNGKPGIILETSRDSVGGATAEDFQYRKFPDWWAGAVKAYYEQRRSNINASKTIVAAPVPERNNAEEESADDEAATGA